MATAPTVPAAPKGGPVAVPALEAKLGKGPGKIGVLIFGVVLIIGVVYAGSQLISDLSGVHNASILPYVLLGLALLVALGFELAAIIWNLSTWYFGLPASSSHTLIGSIIGVGIANQLMAARTGTSGVDWAQALNRATVRNLSMAWVLTLPVSMMLAAFLFWGFRNIF